MQVEQSKAWLERICKAGKFDYYGVRKNVPTLKELEQINPQLLSELLGISFTKSATLSGFKEEISLIDKNDIRELLDFRFSHLKISDIIYAFKINRYGEMGEPISGYQLFNAEFVAKVLDQFLAWRKQMSTNPAIIRQEEEERKALEAPPQIAFAEVVKSFYQNFKKGFTFGLHSLFEKLEQLGEINLTIEQKWEIYRRAELKAEEIHKREFNEVAFVLRRNLRDRQQSSKSEFVKTLAQEIAVYYYFKSITDIEATIERIKNSVKTF